MATILDQKDVQASVSAVVEKLGEFLDRPRPVIAEEFTDPDGGAVSIWLRVSCSVEDASAVHDCIDRFYSEWWWDRMEQAPVMILVGVGG